MSSLRIGQQWISSLEWVHLSLILAPDSGVSKCFKKTIAIGRQTDGVALLGRSDRARPDQLATLLAPPLLRV
jgi:hypothetical protein